jgi:hypothetical protein
MTGKSLVLNRPRIRPTLAIVRDESSDGHRLQCMREDADCGMIDASRARNKITRSCAFSFDVGLKVHGFRSAMVHFSPHYVGFGL